MLEGHLCCRDCSLGDCGYLHNAPPREATADVHLVRRMKVSLTKIHQHHQAGIFEAAMTLELGEPDARPTVAALWFRVARITGKLDEINWEVALLPNLAPARDESPQLGQIDLRVVVAVGFTLIPKQTFKGVGD